MSEREKQIIKTFAIIIPKLSECDKSYLLGLGEGMAIKVESQGQKSEKTLVATQVFCLISEHGVRKNFI